MLRITDGFRVTTSTLGIAVVNKTLRLYIFNEELKAVYQAAITLLLLLTAL